jgi:hypothetical protein
MCCAYIHVEVGHFQMVLEVLAKLLSRGWIKLPNI